MTPPFPYRSFGVAFDPVRERVPETFLSIPSPLPLLPSGVERGPPQTSKKKWTV